MDSFVSLQELASFYHIDRQVYAKLVRNLSFDPNLSKKIVAFWYWLERKGCKHFINNALHLSNAQLFGVAMETITCLDFLNRDWNFVSMNTLSLPYIHAIVSQGFSFPQVYADRENCILAMENFLKKVCDKVFFDRDETNSVNGFQSEPLVPVGSRQVDQTDHVRVAIPGREETRDFRQDRHENEDGCNSQMVATDQKDLGVGDTDRTLFITFSKGHPISKEELGDLIERTYGDCVEAIHMRSEPEPLFARVVVNSVSVMEKILRGRSIVKLSVNGKDVWLRHFIPKHAS